jgi:hypothetical protein
MDTLNVIFYCAAATSLMALPFLLVNWVRYGFKMRSPCGGGIVRAPAKFPIKSTVFFLLPILIVDAISNFMTTSARDEVLKFISGLSGHYTVDVNLQRVDDADKIISALKGIAPVWAHHSHPTRKIRVDIQGGHGDLTLELGRDSGNPNEYWVFQPEYGVTSNNEIGRITTSVFDAY